MLNAIVRIKFSQDTDIAFGVKYLENLLSTGSSKKIAIPLKSRESLCKYHKDIQCEIIQIYDNNIVDVQINFPYCLSGATSGISELINSLLYCSVFSFVENYIVEDFYLDNEVEIFKGPRYGVDGIRDISEVYQSPLLGLILKPRTKIELKYQQYLIENLCNSGLINYLIDDELVVTPNCCKYKEKISLYSETIKTIQKRTGKNLIYWVNATADIDIAKKIIDFSMNKGINTFCLNPVTMGFSSVKYLIDIYEKKAIFLANNIGRGVLSRPPHYYITEKVLAKLSRLVGADAVYTGPISNPFPYNVEILKEERCCLQDPFCCFKPSFAVTSGDISNGKNVAENINAIGNNVMIQMGGGLLSEKASERLKVFSFIANYTLNEAARKEVSDAFSFIEENITKKGDLTMNNNQLTKKRSEQLAEYINKQLLLRNEYKHAMTVTRDPQDLFKFKEELAQCENTILDFTYELNELVVTCSDIVDIDYGLYKTILQISNLKLTYAEESELTELVKNLDSVFEKANNICTDDVKKKINDYNLQTSMHNKLELSIPIIPSLLSYKVDLSLDLSKSLRNVMLKILDLARKKK